MKKVLYITVKTVPYKTKLFNALSEHVDLTVAYESEDIGDRNSQWSNSERLNHKHVFLSQKESSLSFFLVSYQLIKYILKGWDEIIVGCFNLKPDIIAILFMKLFHINYILNLDGETFFEGNGIKQKIKRFLVKGATSYLIAGEKSAIRLKNVVGESAVILPYYFSSLCDREIANNSNVTYERKNYILVVGQYFDYKGLDIALMCAKMDPSIKYKFVGMGKRTGLFVRENGPIPENVEIVPFLQKEELSKEYQHCRILLLPSRQECWGLVVNEAASFGTPIVSTWGSGAAIEMLSDYYPQYLAIPGNPMSLLKCLRTCLQTSQKDYCEFLKIKSKKYTIENMVKAHVNI